MKLGKLLKSSREKRALTIRGLEEKSGVSNALISQIETGYVKNPGFWTVAKLARALGITMKRLSETEQ